MSEQAKSLEKPRPASHSDNPDSALPKRDDSNRDIAPNDPPRKKNDELPVG